MSCDELETPVPRPLDQQICFTLYATSMAIGRLYKPMLDELGLTYPQYLVLSTLSEAGDLTIGGIAGRLDLESSTVTPLVKRLEAAGLVVRRRGVEDERKVEVAMTDEGRALLGRCACLNDALLEHSGLTPQDLMALNANLQAFHTAILDR